MGVLHHVRQPQVDQMARLLRTMDESQDPVEIISTLIRVRGGSEWGREAGVWEGSLKSGRGRCRREWGQGECPRPDGAGNVVYGVMKERKALVLLAAIGCPWRNY